MNAPLRLTAEEHALVTAFEAFCGVTICPPAVGTASPARMSPEARARHSEAVLASPLHRRYRIDSQAPAIARRRRVERLLASGAGRREIAATLGVCISTIDKDLRALRRRQG